MCVECVCGVYVCALCVYMVCICVVCVCVVCVCSVYVYHVHGMCICAHAWRQLWRWLLDLHIEAHGGNCSVFCESGLGSPDTWGEDVSSGKVRAEMDVGMKGREDVCSGV